MIPFFRPNMGAAEKYWLGAISLPVFPGMTEVEVNDVIMAANEAINEV